MFFSQINGIFVNQDQLFKYRVKKKDGIVCLIRETTKTQTISKAKCAKVEEKRGVLCYELRSLFYCLH